MTARRPIAPRARRRLARWLLVPFAGALTMVGVACAARPTVDARAVRDTSTGASVDSSARQAAQKLARAAAPFALLGDIELSQLLVCADSLGRVARRALGRRCTPCVPFGTMSTAASARDHARTLWARTGRTPWSVVDISAACAVRAWVLSDHWPFTPVDVADRALFDLASSSDSTRRGALRLLDSALTAALARGDTTAARETLGPFALGWWQRAQLALQRPLDERFDEREIAVRDIDPTRAPGGTVAWTTLPRPPARSPTDRWGASEAAWAARLFTTLATLTPTAGAERSRWLRFALSPWVAQRAWGSLDSAAAALLRVAPGDSAVLPARALAAYHRVRMPVREQPAVMALFDSVLRALPRVDSARYDSFDAVLTRDDDVWREAFLPSARVQLETRGWLVYDPLWSTPVNEVRLARRARVAEADYLYADVARPGESGSETAAGQVLLRRGAPAARWTSGAAPGPFRSLTGGWPSLAHIVRIEETDELWRTLHVGWTLPQRYATMAVGRTASECQSVLLPITFAACSERARADWRGVPFFGTLDTIDVMAARFRTGGDAMDLYIGARLPVRAFPPSAPTARGQGQVRLGAFVMRPDGRLLWQDSSWRALPGAREEAWTHQWTARIPTGELLHRVEAMEPFRLAGARGVMLFTSDAAVALDSRGFGLSDLLVAARATERRTPARRWTDLALTPNGGVVRPRESFAVAWEIYDLTPGPDGRVRWRVEISRELGARTTRADMREVLVGSPRAGTRVQANEPDASSLRYEREAPASAIVVEHVRLPLPDSAGEGRHVIAVRVTDVNRGTTVERSVGVRLMREGAQRRKER